MRWERIGRHGRRPTVLQWVAAVAEAVPIAIIFGMVKLVPLDAASALGGFVFRQLGPRLKGLHSRVLRNIQTGLPDLSEDRHREIAIGFWDNLGRTVFEYPHLQALRRKGRITIVGHEVLRLSDAHSGPVLGFCGHFANWELHAAVVDGMTRPLGLVYRPPNNPLINRALFRIRRRFGVHQISKGKKGGRSLVEALQAGTVVGMLVDQHLTNGLDLTFLGAPARTAPALARLARNYNAMLAPVQLERVGGANFRLTIHPLWSEDWTDDADADVARVMARVNSTLGDWVRARPEQWLWLHDRFKTKSTPHSVARLEPDVGHRLSSQTGGRVP